ncbi:MAG: trypsin-like peptidase domain-containing protein [Limnospira sp.]
MFKKIKKNRILVWMAVAIASLAICIAMTAVGSNASTNSLPSRPIPKPQLQAVNPSETNSVNSIAKAVTVFIGREIESRQTFEQAIEDGATFPYAGSGLIVARRDSTYYVLTNQHVVAGRAKYAIRTYDGELHQVENSLPPFANSGQKDDNQNTVTRFGELNSQKKAIDGYDLALLHFESDKNYPIAVMGDANMMTVGTPVFVSGWPLPSDRSRDRIRVLRVGELKRILDPSDPNGNYSLCYTAETAVGMSGGPVFNDRGELIGVHGAGKNYRPRCIDTSLGIKINDFIDEQEKIGRYRLKNDFRRPPANPSEFARMVTNSNADTLRGSEYQKLFDVSPTDPDYQAILFVSQYGCMGAYDDGTFRPRYEATRGEFVMDLSRCMKALEGVASQASRGGGGSRTDFESIKRSVNELTREVESLSDAQSSDLLW